jgi:hypothetical protein
MQFSPHKKHVGWCCYEQVACITCSFETCPGYRLPGLRFRVVFTSPSRQTPVYHNRFLPDPFQFIIHLSFLMCSFETCPGYRLPGLRFSVVFTSPSRQIPVYHNLFLPNPFQFIIHPGKFRYTTTSSFQILSNLLFTYHSTIRCYRVWGTKSVVKQNISEK